MSIGAGLLFFIYGFCVDIAIFLFGQSDTGEKMFGKGLAAGYYAGRAGLVEFRGLFEPIPDSEVLSALGWLAASPALIYVLVLMGVTRIGPLAKNGPKRLIGLLSLLVYAVFALRHFLTLFSS